jgi:hypothetical protein
MIGFTGTSLQVQSTITAHNQWLPKTRSIPYWTTSVFSSTVTDTGSDLRIGHFFSFRCPLVNTPQLNTQLLNSLTTASKWIHQWTLFYSSELIHVLVFLLQHASSLFTCCVFTSSCLVATANSGLSPSSEFPKLSPCFSYQLLTATAHKDWPAAVL